MAELNSRAPSIVFRSLGMSRGLMEIYGIIHTITSEKIKIQKATVKCNSKM
jgi:hypothetical protein